MLAVEEQGKDPAEECPSWQSRDEICQLITVASTGLCSVPEDKDQNNTILFKLFLERIPELHSGKPD